MRFDGGHTQLATRIAPSSMLWGLWHTLIWPGVRIMLKVLALPLAVFVGLPACVFTLACLLRALHMGVGGHILLAIKMLLAAWCCGTVAAAAFWPRRAL